MARGDDNPDDSNILEGTTSTGNSLKKEKCFDDINELEAQLSVLDICNSQLEFTTQEIDLNVIEEDNVRNFSKKSNLSLLENNEVKREKQIDSPLNEKLKINVVKDSNDNTENNSDEDNESNKIESNIENTDIKIDVVKDSNDTTANNSDDDNDPNKIKLIIENATKEKNLKPEENVEKLCNLTNNLSLDIGIYKKEISFEVLQEDQNSVSDENANNYESCSENDSSDEAVDQNYKKSTSTDNLNGNNDDSGNVQTSDAAVIPEELREYLQDLDKKINNEENAGKKDLKSRGFEGLSIPQNQNSRESTDYSQIGTSNSSSVRFDQKIKHQEFSESNVFDSIDFLDGNQFQANLYGFNQNEGNQAMGNQVTQAGNSLHHLNFNTYDGQQYNCLNNFNEVPVLDLKPDYNSSYDGYNSPYQPPTPPKSVSPPQQDLDDDNCGVLRVINAIDRAATSEQCVIPVGEVQKIRNVLEGSEDSIRDEMGMYLPNNNVIQELINDLSDLRTIPPAEMDIYMGNQSPSCDLSFARQIIQDKCMPNNLDHVFRLLSALRPKTICQKDEDGDTPVMITFCTDDHHNYYENIFCLQEQVRAIKVCCETPLGRAKKCKLCHNSDPSKYYTPLSIKNNLGDTVLHCVVKSHKSEEIVNFLLYAIAQNQEDIRRTFDDNSNHFFMKETMNYPLLEQFQ